MTTVSQSRGSSWISTPKSTSSKSNRVVPKLYQSSLHDFVKRKPKATQARVQKENREIGVMSTSTKRKQSAVEDHGQIGKAEKKRKICDARAHDSNYGPTQQRSKHLGDDLKSPIIIPDSQFMDSWDDTTVWDSAVSSRTLRDAFHGSTPGSSKSTLRKKVNDIRNKGASRSFKIPTLSIAQPRTPARILVLDTPSPSHDIESDDDPFVAAPRRRKFSGMSRNVEVIPSSQPQEIEHIDAEYSTRRSHVSSSQNNHTDFASLPYPSSAEDFKYSPKTSCPKMDESIPSSQSQYILPYRASPVRPDPRIDDDSSVSSTTIPTEVVPSSQILEEQELKVPSPYHRGRFTLGIPSKQGKEISSAPDLNGSSSTILSPMDFREDQILTTPLNKGASGLRCPSPSTPQRSAPAPPPTQASSPSAIDHCPSCSPHSPPQTESLSFLNSISPPSMASSQYSYRSGDASYPPEMKTFLSMFDEDRGSLRSIFQGTSLAQSLPIEASQEKDNPVDCVPSGSIPDPEHQMASPSLPSGSSESISTQALRTGLKSQYTFVEESCPPVVVNFLDMLEQDRRDLGSQFQASV